ncbi:MAG: hypothetical protein ACJ0P6_00780 [Flavobacteriaceae bacterium]
MKYVKIILLLSFTIFIDCDDGSNINENTPIEHTENLTGSGYFEYSDYTPFADKTLKIHYYIPNNTTSSTKILFVFHGNGRNAMDYRDAMISKSNQYNFIVVAPEFSSTNFPGGDAYNLGNVYEDGDNPSPSSLNPEPEWTFSVIEPLFDYIKTKIDNSTLKYHVFGHSAGGQFAHRFLMFKPTAQIDKIIVSAPGWYTTTDYNTAFPYGFSNSILENIVLDDLFDKKLTLLIGDLDNDPDSGGLRHNQFADAQGLHRLERAQYFYNKAATLSANNNLDFQWTFEINTDADHSFTLASSKAADLIFN